MMQSHKEYILEEETAKYAAEKFGASIENVRQLNDQYNKIISCIPYQYLAHIIRTIEAYIRKTTDSPIFRITCEPRDLTESHTEGLACATYEKDISFDIIYDKKLDEWQTRIHIAHELGHLLWTIVGDTEYKDNHEPLPSICCMLIMLHKESLHGKNTKSHELSVVDDCVLTMNEVLGKYNIS